MQSKRERDRQAAKPTGVPPKGVKSDQCVVSKFCSSLLYLNLKYLHIITRQSQNRDLKRADAPVIRHSEGTAILRSLYLETAHSDCTWGRSLEGTMKSYSNSPSIPQNSEEEETFGIRIPVSHRDTYPAFFSSCQCFFPG